MKPLAIVAYLLLLAPALLLAAVVWQYVAVNKMFYCWDSVGVPGDFIPPFVHAARDPRDHYISAPWMVHLLWLVHLGIALTLPRFTVASVSRIFITIKSRRG